MCKWNREGILIKFYVDLSTYYDLVFPFNENTLSFLKGYINSDSKVLDLACGTGTYSIKLMDAVSSVIGIDLDKKMIDLANLKLKKLNCKSNCKSNVTFIADDMTKIDFIEDNSMDLIYCIGNSLVHIPSKEDVTNLINKIHKKLKVNGTLVIQIINFTKIIENNLPGLPTITVDDKSLINNHIINFKDNLSEKSNESKYKFNGEIKKIELIRKYNYDKDKDFKEILKVDFNTILNIYYEDKNTISYENHVDLLNIDSMYFKNNFLDRFNIDFYGSFKMDEFDVNTSMPLIITLKKNKGC